MCTATFFAANRLHSDYKTCYMYHSCVMQGAFIVINVIGVGKFRILGGQGLEYWGGQGLEYWGGPRGGQIPSRHMTS